VHAVGMIKFSIIKGLEHFPELWQQTNEKKKMQLPVSQVEKHQFLQHVALVYV